MLSYDEMMIMIKMMVMVKEIASRQYIPQTNKCNLERIIRILSSPSAFNNFTYYRRKLEYHNRDVYLLISKYYPYKYVSISFISISFTYK